MIHSKFSNVFCHKSRVRMETVPAVLFLSFLKSYFATCPRRCDVCVGWRTLIFVGGGERSYFCLGFLVRACCFLVFWSTSGRSDISFAAFLFNFLGDFGTAAAAAAEELPNLFTWKIQNWNKRYDWSPPTNPRPTVLQTTRLIIISVSACNRCNFGMNAPWKNKIQKEKNFTSGLGKQRVRDQTRR